MDTTDPDIYFDDSGVCNHCHYFDLHAKQVWDPTPNGKSKLDKIVLDIKEKNKNKRYDCILGLSGGLDSSYVALVIKEYNLRALAVHVDGGWNSELAVSNIQTIIEYCGFDLHTYVVNWETMRNLQLAYFKSGVSNLDVPQDHVFFAVLHSEALAYKCNVFISGGNVATESVFPQNWHGDAMDRINLIDINRTHGNGSLKDYKTISFLDWHILFRLRGFYQLRPLNYLPYGVQIAKTKLSEIGWRAYPRKHGESIFTKFFQNYFLPTRFGYDKRLPHLSSRILSGDISRQHAIELLSEPLYDEKELLEDKDYIAKKLGITINELNSFLYIPKKDYSQYKNWDSRVNALRYCSSLFRQFKRFLK
ncbi:N-acetyl sugar amidotransferase [Candidatus Synechococcus calcipolaris G9]|uniref:N-acetyl sugar amidotransferase n=2 Tax=Synechococcus TaxID=1129 RepID=A0ABT6EUQ0_9SYNE|nr:N-acetyl sugar amidotransferase [Candidatus Synechococcus calcipolaris G9]